MRRIRFLLFTVASAWCFGAYSQSNYLDFIQSDNKIQWAAQYAQIFEITPKIRQYGIKKILSNQFKRAGYIDDYSIENGEVVKKRYSNYDSIPKFLFTSPVQPYKRYLNNLNLDIKSSFVGKEQQCDCIGNISKNNFEIYRLLQVISYKDAGLYLRNILVTPLCLKDVNDSAGESKYTWEGCISSAPKNGKYAAPINKKLIDLGNFEQSYDLRYNLLDDNNQVTMFTLKNPTFSRHLYEDIMDDKVTVVDYQNNIIPSKQVQAYQNPPVEVPVYDSTGKFIKSQKFYPEINLDSIYDFTINQHFYFDTINNILYSTVNYIEAVRNVVTSMGINLGKATWIRIYFVKPSLYRKQKLKRYLNS